MPNASYDLGKLHGFIFGFILTIVILTFIITISTKVALPYINGEGYYRGWTEATQKLNLPSVSEINNMSKVCSQLK
tara:strand:- start:4849 stop:5076 length:228 start_codon:yes stop_codon:yes gene_type:complete